MKDRPEFHRHSWQKTPSKVPPIVKSIAVFLALILAYGIVGTMDYEDAVAREQKLTGGAK